MKIALPGEGKLHNDQPIRETERRGQVRGKANKGIITRTGLKKWQEFSLLMMNKG